jgi:hypothetical protein
MMMLMGIRVPMLLVMVVVVVVSLLLTEGQAAGQEKVAG